IFSLQACKPAFWAAFGSRNDHRFCGGAAAGAAAGATSGGGPAAGAAAGIWAHKRGTPPTSKANPVPQIVHFVMASVLSMSGGCGTARRVAPALTAARKRSVIRLALQEISAGIAA